MPKPRRVQLSRRKGFKLPENTVVVSRPTRWGNPYKLSHYDVTSFPKAEQAHVQRGLATRDHWMWLRAMPEGEAVAERARIELRGKNLACWCPLPKRGEPDECHAANLIDVANDDAIVIRPVKPSNSSVLGYSRAKWLRAWWERALWNRATPSRNSDRTVYKTVLAATVATLHVPCGEPQADSAVYRVRSRIAVGDKIRGKRVIRSWAERVDGVWCWIYEVGNVLRNRGKRNDRAALARQGDGEGTVDLAIAYLRAVRDGEESREIGTRLAVAVIGDAVGDAAESEVG